MNRKIVCAALAAILTCAPVSAAEVMTSAVFDLSEYNFDGMGDRVGLIELLDLGANAVLLPGDTLVGTVSFKDDRPFTLFNDTQFGGPESLAVILLGNDGPVFFSSELSFTGVTGDYVGPALVFFSLISLDDYFGGMLRASAFTNLTDSSFTFTGITFRTTYLSGNATQFNSAVLQVAGQPITTVQSAVPEPATWAMMLIGFGAVGYSMRRQRRSGFIFHAV